jgi:hypothetical protein
VHIGEHHGLEYTTSAPPVILAAIGERTTNVRLSTAAIRPITDEGVAVGGAFDSDTATGLMPIAHLVAGVRSFP